MTQLDFASQIRIYLLSVNGSQSFHHPTVTKVNGSSLSLSPSPASAMASSAIEDIFESSLNLEERHLQEGYNEGYNDGLASGREEGKEVGLKVGFEVGEELGFYKGCVEVWKAAFEICPDGFSARVRRNVKQMAELIERYPILEPENEGVQDLMDALRAKFKAVSAMLSVRLEYAGFPGLKAEDKAGF